MREEYKDNLIRCDTISEMDQEIRDSYKKTGDWLPIEVYDLVQCGYPYPDHGEMIIIPDRGTNEKSELLPPTGMWCKASDVRKLLKKLKK